MAKVHFAPMYAVRYVGTKTKEFSTSLARPKPTLNTGDILIVDKRQAFILTKKGFGDFEQVENIEALEFEISDDAINDGGGQKTPSLKQSKKA